MKLIMFGVDDKEVPYAKEWATKTGNEVKLVREQLTTSTIDLVEGFDGISVLQTSKIDDPAIYTKLKQFGIKQLSTRTAVLPLPDEVPRPTRLRTWREPSAGFNSCNFMSNPPVNREFLQVSFHGDERCHRSSSGPSAL